MHNGALNARWSRVVTGEATTRQTFGGVGDYFQKLIRNENLSHIRAGDLLGSMIRWTLFEARPDKERFRMFEKSLGAVVALVAGSLVACGSVSGSDPSFWQPAQGFAGAQAGLIPN